MTSEGDSPQPAPSNRAGGGAPRASQGLPGDGGRGRQDLLMLLEGHAELEAGRDVVIGLLETHGRAETARMAEGLPMLPRLRVTYRRHGARGDGPDRDPAPRARAVPDRRARPHERSRRRAPQALRGRRGGPRGRHRRDLDGQRPAPRVAQRPDHRAQRHPCEGDDPRRHPRASRRGRAHRRHTRRPARPPARRQDLSRPSESMRRSTTSSRSRTSPRCARSRCARSPRRSAPSASPPSLSARARRPWPRMRRRPSASGCSRWSSPTRAPSASCAARGALPSASALSWTCCGCAGPGRSSQMITSAR